MGLLLTRLLPSLTTFLRASTFLVHSRHAKVLITVASSLSGASALLSLALHYRHSQARLATSADIVSTFHPSLSSLVRLSTPIERLYYARREF